MSTLTQSHFRFGKDDGTESSHTFWQLEDVNHSQEITADWTFLLRFCEQVTTAISNVDAQFQYNKNAAGWVDITTSSVIVKAVAVNAFTNGQVCTKRLSGTGTFETSAAGCTEDGSSGGTTNDIVLNGNSETEAGLQVVFAQVVNGDTIQFRLTSPDATMAYAVTPTLTIVIAALTAVGDEVQKIWNIRQAVPDTNQYVYNIRQAVADTIQKVWNVRTTVFDTTQSVWNLRTLASQTRQAVWNVQVLVSKTIQVVHNTLTTIGDTAETIWNVLAGIPVGDTFELIWNLRQIIGDTSGSLWNVRQTVYKANQYVWHILNPIADSMESIWGVRTAIGQTKQALWNVRYALSDIVSAVWDVLANPILATKSIIARWNIGIRRLRLTQSISRLRALTSTQVGDLNVASSISDVFGLTSAINDLRCLLGSENRDLVLYSEIDGE